MKRTLGLAACLLLIAAEADDKGKKEDPVGGTWLVESMLSNGKPPRVPINGMSYKFADGKMTLRVPQGERYQTYKTDASEKPAAIDLTAQDGPAKGKTVKGIYEVKGDEMKMCFAAPDADRPKEFVSKEGSNTVLLTLKREKGGKP